MSVALVTAIVIVAVAGVAFLSVGWLHDRDRDGAGDGDTDTAGALADTGPDGAASGAEVPGATTDEQASGLEAARDFLDRYVDDDGRVVRPDDGNDTVSEGQAYGMLLAAAIGDQERFDLLWSWSRDHLRQRNGLLAWRWADGAVVDSNSAADADLDTAHALLLAAERFDQPRYREDAVALGEAILARETVTGRDRRPVLVAGPWAREGEPMVNPSYVSPVAYESLGQATGDERWRQLTETGLDHLRELTDDGRMLPPDWARLRSDGSVVPTPAPGQDTIRYGYEAFRVLPRLAGACTQEARDLAAALWTPVSQTVVERAETHHLDGQPEQSGSNGNLLVAGAAAAHAAGQTGRRDALLAEADAMRREYPAYYLGAWTALGHLLLQGTSLGGCPDANARDLSPTTTGAGAGDQASGGTAGSAGSAGDDAESAAFDPETDITTPDTAVPTTTTTLAESGTTDPDATSGSDPTDVAAGERPPAAPAPPSPAGKDPAASPSTPASPSWKVPKKVATTTPPSTKPPSHF